jgi:hypothetical protein
MAYFTKKEFETIRTRIDDLFHDDILKYKVSKSSYAQAAKYDWRIHVRLTATYTYCTSPYEKLNIVKHLFTKVDEFLKDETLVLAGVVSRDDFGFEFTFQPVDLRAAKLLEGI